MRGGAGSQAASPPIHFHRNHITPSWISLLLFLAYFKRATRSDLVAAHIGPTRWTIRVLPRSFAREMGGGAVSAMGAIRGHGRPTKRATLAAGAACAVLLVAWMAAVGPQGAPSVPGAVIYGHAASGAAASDRSGAGDGRAHAYACGDVR